MKAVKESRCVYCDCTDSRACAGGCSWISVDRKSGLGVCSNCEGKGNADFGMGGKKIPGRKRAK